VSWNHHLALSLLLPLPYIFIYLCNKTSPDAPHIISRTSHAQNATLYPYDYKLFHPNCICRTCQFPKVARSKHCSICRRCIARADHHCVWVNNCLGRGNYKYFLGLLLSITSLLVYAALLGYLTVAPQVRADLAQNPIRPTKSYILSLGNQGDGGRQWRENKLLAWVSRWLDTFNSALVVGGMARTGVGLLALMTVPLPAGLLAYHLHLVCTGMTTNERSKWGDWRAELANGSGYIAPIVSKDQANQGAICRWPKHSEQILVLTSDGFPPRNLQPALEAVVGEHVEWRRCSSLKDVDNIYDLGPWYNLMEVLLD
jgi:hypothetical protein